MPRVKRGTIHLKKRRKLMKAVKGYKWGRKNKIRLARPAMLKAGARAFKDRKVKKRTFRGLWQIQISAACKPFDLSYSKFIGMLKKAKIEIDRKVLADLAQNNPKVFAKIIEKAKSAK
jgi:large subunit ribosomal protein L20